MQEEFMPIFGFVISNRVLDMNKVSLRKYIKTIKESAKSNKELYKISKPITFIIKENKNIVNSVKDVYKFSDHNYNDYYDSSWSNVKI